MPLSSRRAGAAASGALLSVAGLHAYWAGGGLWPGHTQADLAATVVGPPGTPWPGARATWVVTGLLVTAAGVVGAAGAGRGGPIILRGARGVAGVFLLRGAGGLVLSRRREHRFARLDVALYSPLCIALGAMSGVAAHVVRPAPAARWWPLTDARGRPTR